MNMFSPKEDVVTLFSLRVARDLHDFTVAQALPGTVVDADRFWEGFAQIVHDLGPKNRALLEQRDEFQLKLDTGDTSDNDELAAITGIEAAGLKAVAG